MMRGFTENGSLEMRVERRLEFTGDGVAKWERRRGCSSLTLGKRVGV